MNLPRDIIYEIVMESDICTLVNLYDTNKQYRSMLTDERILTLLSKKYDEPITGIYDLTKICLYQSLVPDFGESKYLEGELLRAVQRIKYRYYNDGDRIDYCKRNKYSQRYNSPICYARDFLIKYGFKNNIDQLEDMVQHSQDNYKKWINTLETAVINHVILLNGNYSLLPVGESAILPV